MRRHIKQRNLIIVPEFYEPDKHDGEKRRRAQRQHDPEKNCELRSAVYLRRLGKVVRCILKYRIEHQKIHSQKIRFLQPDAPKRVIQIERTQQLQFGRIIADNRQDHRHDDDDIYDTAEAIRILPSDKLQGRV